MYILWCSRIFGGTNALLRCQYLPTPPGQLARCKKASDSTLGCGVSDNARFFAPAQVKGFCGAQLFSNKAAGTLHSITLWESWGALETAAADPRYAEVSPTPKLVLPPVTMCHYIVRPIGFEGTGAYLRAERTITYWSRAKFDLRSAQGTNTSVSSISKWLP